MGCYGAPECWEIQKKWLTFLEGDLVFWKSITIIDIVMQWSSSNCSRPERILSSQFIIRQRLHINSPLRVLVLAQKENEVSWAKRIKAVLVVQTTRDTSHRNWNPSTSDDLFSFRSDLTPRQPTLSANHVFHSRKTTSCPVQSVVRRLLIGDDEIRSGNSRCTYSR